MQMNVGYSERRDLTSVLELRGGVKESWHGVEQRPVRRKKGGHVGCHSFGPALNGQKEGPTSTAHKTGGELPEQH